MSLKWHHSSKVIQRNPEHYIQYANKALHARPYNHNYVKKIVPDIIEEITVIINTCLTTGKFPEDWKLVLVKPFLKKLNLELINHN